MLSRPNSTVVVAVPKGRVLKQLIPRLERAGIDSAALTADNRKLIREDPRQGLRFLLLKPDDVPTYVEYGTADLGVVGRDILLERNYDLYSPVDLGVGRCRLMVCGKPGTSLDELDGTPLRVATKFPNIATRHFLAKSRPVELIFVQGSVELAPLTGLADVIIDLVETGETLKQNGLVPLEPICDVTSVLVANRVGLKLKSKVIAPFIESLRASA